MVDSPKEDELREGPLAVDMRDLTQSDRPNRTTPPVTSFGHHCFILMI